ncbi:putative sun domain protein [Phaeomoniella chlamydospora]|uniref:Putative sun domain protein n=1 Tax=Phaeomoniella chlamydospora TaxID=158046 RepID=A0A0G2E037_PHACM|nr:putative sun domain protein [Phaeomoniella chlamydospora]
MLAALLVLAAASLANAQPRHAHVHRHVHVREASATASASSSSSTSSSDTFTDALAESSYDDFPDGTLSCSDGPPTKYGAITVDYLDLAGWSGLQVLSSDYSEIESTGTSGDSCTSGMACSYSCAPGWQKLQWNSDQPDDGTTIGGLLCKDGLLYLANNNTQLCGQGNGLTYVENKASSGISVCRTDYPGTEAETVPLDVSSGDTQPLTTPIEEEYFEWQGSYTSAQYYLNPIGTEADPGCSWDGNGDGNSGNSAPITIGAGQLDGTTWLSISQNTPTTYNAYSGRVEISGDSLSGSCYYENGEFCSDSGCTEHTVSGAGCTVSTTGTATFVISES